MAGNGFQIRIERLGTPMKKLFALSFVLLFASTAFAQSNDDSIVRWNSIVGVITSPGVDNPVAGISSGTLPWAVTAGTASVDLDAGTASFFVNGLVLVGGNATGTPGPIQQVVGTLVCNPGMQNQSVHDTPTTPLDEQGNADFKGSIGTIPSLCSNPIFLIRLANPTAGRWLATGTVRVTRNPRS
jgi:hypothetical protein